MRDYYLDHTKHLCDSMKKQLGDLVYTLNYLFADEDVNFEGELSEVVGSLDNLIQKIKETQEKLEERENENRVEGE